MKRIFLLLILLLSFNPAQAATLNTPAGNRLSWQLPAGWIAPTEPPQALLDQIALQLGQEARLNGKNPTHRQLVQAAQQRLTVNELLLYHPRSGAWVSFDFSPLRQGEDPPSAASLELSAHYALESLSREDEFQHPSGSQRAQLLPGTQGTRRLDARYRQQDVEVLFNGLIGYLTGEWFFIYATSYPAKADVSKQIDKLFSSLKFET
ncbi:hypothetical protein [Geopsychrobacter electrodiphilus]|uniref:hypothetical protein n=1 Tax=Geopsychrobacter electrodiphilus TaxID=225196 RepID=UPI00036CB84D|nr:hypothetical protein [Geopsychrobacter electrodiphilus]